MDTQLILMIAGAVITAVLGMFSATTLGVAGWTLIKVVHMGEKLARLEQEVLDLSKQRRTT